MDSPLPAAADGSRGRGILTHIQHVCPVFERSVLLDSWFGRTIYEARDEWLHTGKILFGYRRDAFDYDLDLLTECHIFQVDGGYASEP